MHLCKNIDGEGIFCKRDRSPCTINMIIRKENSLIKKQKTCERSRAKLIFKSVNFCFFLPSPISCIFHSLHSLLTVDTRGSISHVTVYPRAMEKKIWLAVSSVYTYFLQLFKGFPRSLVYYLFVKHLSKLFGMGIKKGIDSQQYEIKNTDEDFSHK